MRPRRPASGSRCAGDLDAWQIEIHVNNPGHGVQKLVEGADSSGDKRKLKTKTVLKSRHARRGLLRDNRFREPVLDAIEIVDQINRARSCFGRLKSAQDSAVPLN